MYHPYRIAKTKVPTWNESQLVPCWRFFSLHVYTIGSISIDKSPKKMYNIKRHEKQ